MATANAETTSSSSSDLGFSGEEPLNVLKCDLKFDGALGNLRRAVMGDALVGGGEVCWNLLVKLYDLDANLHDFIVFSEVRGDMSTLLRLAGEFAGYQYHETSVDNQGFRLASLLKPIIASTRHLVVTDYVVDLSCIYEQLRSLQQKQKDATATASRIVIGCRVYSVDLTSLDFSRVPPVRPGLQLVQKQSQQQQPINAQDGNRLVRFCQYVPPGPPNPATFASVLAKVMHLNDEVRSCNSPLIGDFNMPLDLPVKDTTTGENVVESVFRELAVWETDANHGHTTRLTLLDIIGRRRLGFAGFVPQEARELKDLEYVKVMQDFRSSLDRVYHCSPTSGVSQFKGWFGPQLSPEALARAQTYLWSPEFLQLVGDAKSQDAQAPKKPCYDNLNALWDNVAHRLEVGARLSFDEVLRLLWEEDHLRFGFRLQVPAATPKD